jgi:eukaryotic-like serine/threonine-protein kinase
MKYTYRSGQTPLEGYTIKRGVGQGGFGEVYFAISDGGKEVALKLLHGQSDVELRGVANCLNMKHPNLVHVYDMKEDKRGDKWLIMEYVLGESLSAVLNRHPTGLPHNMIREWFAALARAVAHLHDRGVVHRDLKPANIFIESGTLKVGDYGLCKSISVSQKQTKTVGTVHYMAPEVSTGNYSQKIDIYACGIILYEMLTGKLPFDGESDGEILMKHLTATPDLKEVPEAFRGVLAKALDKNPLKRYESMNDMARVVDQIFSGTVLNDAIATPLATPVAVPVATPMAEKIPSAEAIPQAKAAAVLERPKLLTTDNTPLPQAKQVTWRQKVAGRMGAMLLAPLVAGLGLLPYALFTSTPDWLVLVKLIVMSTVLSWVILLAAGQSSVRSADNWHRRLSFGIWGMLAGLLAFWLDGWTFPTNGKALDYTVLAKYGLYFGGVLAMGRWWKAVARDRKERIGLYPLVAAAFCPLVLIFLWPPIESTNTLQAVLPMVAAVLGVQAASPWTPHVNRLASKKLKLRKT